MVSAQPPDQTPTVDAPYYSFYPEVVKRVVWQLDPELWKFYTLASAHVDRLGVLFPGTRAFMGFGYRSDDVKPFYAECIYKGLLRVVFAYTGIATRYQVNPVLLRIRPENLAGAIQLARPAWCPLPGIVATDPDLSDEVRSVIVEVIRGTDPTLRGELGSTDPVTRGKVPHEAESDQIKQIQIKQIQGSSDSQSDRTSESGFASSPRGDEPPTDPTTSEKTESVSASNSNGTDPRNAQNSKSPQRAAQQKHSAESRQQPTTPQPPASRADIRKALESSVDENASKLLVTATGNKTRLPQARRYVVTYGAAAVIGAIREFSKIPREEKDAMKSPAGYLVTMIKVSSGAGDPPPTWELGYDVNNLEICRAAVADPNLSDEEKAPYALAIELDEAQRPDWYVPGVGK